MNPIAAIGDFTIAAATAPVRGAKALNEMIFGRMMFSAGRGLLPNTRFNYEARTIPDRNSIVMAVVNWMARVFPEAPIVVQRPDDDGLMQIDVKHEMVRLLRRPNPYYGGGLLKMSLVLDYMLTGNAYVFKVRSASNRVVELWWAPASMVEPKGGTTGDTFITHYDYRPGGMPIKIDREDVVHLRWGLDPKNPRKGLGPMASLFREIFTDDEAANFTASMLRNNAAPGTILSPKGGHQGTDEEIKEVKRIFRETFGGDNRGDVMVMSGETNVTKLTWSPKDLVLDKLRQVPEERISAVFGLGAIVINLGAGLERSIYSNMAEAREAAYEGAMIPIQRLWADDLSVQLLPDFDTDLDAEVAFDYRQVRILQEDEDKKAVRWTNLVQGSVAKRSEARAAFGLPVVDADDDVYLVPITVMEVAPGERIIPTTPSERREDALEASLNGSE